MMGSLSERIKEAVSIRAAAERYGIHINSKNVALCPFHSEKTPSFHLYPESNSFYCFGCGAGGDVIAFACRIHGLDFRGAISRLDADFGAGISRYPPPRVNRAREATERQKRARERREQIVCYWKATDEWFKMLWEEELTGAAIRKEQDGMRLSMLMARREYLQYWLDHTPKPNIEPIMTDEEVRLWRDTVKPTLLMYPL